MSLAGMTVGEPTPVGETGGERSDWHADASAVMGGAQVEHQGRRRLLDHGSSGGQSTASR
ncbi:MAG TPA: hypothetical protein VHU91_01040 [Mycobacteriales bacterium]|nr:hypothetical protein [Mycobacteriales bacterium]